MDDDELPATSRRASVKSAEEVIPAKEGNDADGITPLGHKIVRKRPRPLPILAPCRCLAPLV